MAVFEGIVADEAQEVVGRSVFLDLGEDVAEVVGIEEGFAASVGGKRGERFLRRSVAVQIVEHGRAGISGLAVEAGRLRFAARRKGLQATNVHRINGDVGFYSGRGGGAQGRLV